MIEINYKYLFGGIFCIAFGIVYLLNLRKRIKANNDKDSDLYTETLNWQGYAGGFCFILIGTAMLFRELIKFYKLLA